MKKVLWFYRRMSNVDFLRKCFLFFNNKISFNFFFRKIKSFYFFKSLYVKIGSNVKVYGQIYNIQLGKNVEIYCNTIFEFGSDAEFSMGNNSLISYGAIISCRNKIVIGQNVQIGEYTSIRDTTHSHKLHEIAMKFQADIQGTITIGSDVWIGRGCIILPNTIISDGVVIGANSVVKGFLQKNGIYAGVPIKLLKIRE